MKLTPKQRVLKKWPNAYARLYGVPGRFVIESDWRSFDLSADKNFTERQAWADAARRLKGRK